MREPASPGVAWAPLGRQPVLLGTEKRFSEQKRFEVQKRFSGSGGLTEEEFEKIPEQLLVDAEGKISYEKFSNFIMNKVPDVDE